jgi:CheY-like chemotaxis protein
MSEDDTRIGAILVRQRSATTEDIERALAAQKTQSPRRLLASQLVESGVLTEATALRGLSEQFGVPGIDLSQVAILLSHLDMVSHKEAIENGVLPVLVRDDRLFLAMENPRATRLIDELEFTTGRKIYPYIALSSTLARAIADAYAANASGKTYYLAPHVPEATLAQLGLHDSAPPLAVTTAPSALSAQYATMTSRSMPAVRALGATPERVGPAKHLATPLDEGAKDTVRPVSVERHDAQARRVSRPDMSVVLIVDDDAETRTMLRIIVEKQGARAMEAASGVDALRIVSEHPPDLILLDAKMPDMHGFELATRIKGSKKLNTIPIVIVSGYYGGWRVLEDLRANYGIADLVEKPFDVVIVGALIRKLLSVTPPESKREDHADTERILREGVDAYNAGDPTRAETILTEGIRIDPNAYKLRYQLALLYAKLDKVHEAVFEMKRAVDVNPKHFPAQKNLAILYERAGFKHAAAEAWERCVPLSPDDETRTAVIERLISML